MAAYIYTKNTEVYNYGKDSVKPETTTMAKAAELNSLRNDLHHGAFVYIMDWYQLDKATKQEIGNQLLCYDRDEDKFIPQGPAL